MGALFRHQLAPRVQNLEQESRTKNSIVEAAIFQPIVTSSRSPFAECDLNAHKSNATFFSDLDVTRTHLLSHLFTNAMRELRLNKGLVFDRAGKVARGPVTFALGASQCSFKREIAPYEAYEMWSRILTWDAKWIYVVTHFVSRKGKGVGALSGSSGSPVHGGTALEKKGKDESVSDGAVSRLVFASAISKQVVKLGRISVDPEIVLVAAGLLPPKSMGGDDAGGLAAVAVCEGVDSRRKRGLEFAKHLGALDGLAEEFSFEDMAGSKVFSDLF